MSQPSMMKGKVLSQLVFLQRCLSKWKQIAQQYFQLSTSKNRLVRLHKKCLRNGLEPSNTQRVVIFMRLLTLRSLRTKVVITV
uniref:Uncharacterized protein n=1 Tax=uncultured marine virus TaxID=186617 RepID=A0A0F7L3E7_9VIRU|nr:hypothetical protein [uncultured marine virus]